MKKENLAMLCDFYEFTMSNGYFKYDFYKRKVYFINPRRLCQRF